MKTSEVDTKNNSFRKLIETGDVEGIKAALESNPGLANETIVWFLNQENESDPLHYVSDCVFNGLLSHQNALAIARLLLEFGAQANGSKGRETPLIGATSLGVSDVACLLIDSGAELESTSIFGSRALHWAASVGLPETVEKLIDHGAELEAKCTEFGATPLFWAVHAMGPDGPNKKKNRSCESLTICWRRCVGGQMYGVWCDASLLGSACDGSRWAKQKEESARCCKSLTICEYGWADPRNPVILQPASAVEEPLVETKPKTKTGVKCG